MYIVMMAYGGGASSIPAVKFTIRSPETDVQSDEDRDRYPFQ